MGPTSQATAYLFAELARLGALESELFVNDRKFRNRERLNPDSEAKQVLMEQLAEADDLATRALTKSPSDTDALLAESIALGLRADYDSLIEKRMLTPLGYTKQSREYAERLLAADPNNYDAYLAPGIENYILSLKIAPVRFLLRLKGAQVDHDKGIDGLERPRNTAIIWSLSRNFCLPWPLYGTITRMKRRDCLRELHQRFPHNPLYLRELDRIMRPVCWSSRASRAAQHGWTK